MSLMMSISGIRGIVGESLTLDVIYKYVVSFHNITIKGPIVIGRDSRVSGDFIVRYVSSILNALGRDVVYLGIAPTPTVLFTVKENNFAGGIVVTASHNPVQWNALKLVNNQGKFLSPDEFASLKAGYENFENNKNNINFVQYDKVGKFIKDTKFVDKHLKRILSFVDTRKIKKCNFKVALDTVNGASGPILLKMLKKLNCKVTKINTEPTGIFAHPAEPNPANLTQLSQKMSKGKYDVGFALDPDGDRLVLADSKGNILSEEWTLPIALEYYLRYKGKSGIVVNLSSSSISEDIANEYGVEIFRVPTGEINVTEELEKRGYKIGGEGNGGIIFYEINKCRDGILGVAIILDFLAKLSKKKKKKIDDIVSDYERYFLIKTKFENVNYDENKILSGIDKIFEKYEIDKRDGLRINFDKGWALIRKSNTEPIVRVFVETKSIDLSKEYVDRLKNIFL